MTQIQLNNHKREEKVQRVAELHSGKEDVMGTVKFEWTPVFRHSSNLAASQAQCSLAHEPVILSEPLM